MALGCCSSHNKGKSVPAFLRRPQSGQQVKTTWEVLGPINFFWSLVEEPGHFELRIFDSEQSLGHPVCPPQAWWPQHGDYCPCGLSVTRLVSLAQTLASIQAPSCLWLWGWDLFPTSDNSGNMGSPCSKCRTTQRVHIPDEAGILGTLT